jgi:hypothetical protein
MPAWCFENRNFVRRLEGNTIVQPRSQFNWCAVVMESGFASVVLLKAGESVGFSTETVAVI